jgi:hypothetical protein
MFLVMVCTWVADGRDGLQIWRVATNILNKQLWTAENGWSFSFEVGCEVKDSLKEAFYRLLYRTVSFSRGSVLHGVY